MTDLKRHELLDRLDVLNGMWQLSIIDHDGLSETERREADLIAEQIGKLYQAVGNVPAPAGTTYTKSDTTRTIWRYVDGRCYFWHPEKQQWEYTGGKFQKREKHELDAAPSDLTHIPLDQLDEPMRGKVAELLPGSARLRDEVRKMREAADEAVDGWSMHPFSDGWVVWRGGADGNQWITTRGRMITVSDECDAGEAWHFQTKERAESALAAYRANAKASAKPAPTSGPSKADEPASDPLTYARKRVKDAEKHGYGPKIAYRKLQVEMAEAFLAGRKGGTR